MSNISNVLVLLSEANVERAKEAFNNFKAHILTVYPELAKTYQFKKLRLIFTDSNGATAGQAWRSSNTIELSLDYLKKHEEEVVTQILGHEMAHIVAPLIYGDKGDGHTPKWKQVMRELGLRPETYHSLEK